MQYVIVVRCDEGWCPGSTVLSSSGSVIAMINSLFQNVTNDDGRVVLGTTRAKLDHALELLGAGMVCPWVTFGDVRDGNPFNASTLSGIEHDYGWGDHDKRYVFSMPTGTVELTHWLRLRDTVLKGGIGRYPDPKERKLA